MLVVDISIHAPLAGSDVEIDGAEYEVAEFQSTLPLRGATPLLLPPSIFAPQFQSTLPLRGATLHSRKKFIHRTHFNPRSPCGERRVSDLHGIRTQVFQSTLPLRGATCRPLAVYPSERFQSTLPLRGATIAIGIAVPRYGFQSTLPLRGATLHAQADPGRAAISIHAPLAGSDVCPSSPTTAEYRFQSTLPLRGATGSFVPSAYR